MDYITAHYGNGKYAVEAQAIICGGDISVTVCGGTQHHVGAVSVGVYEPERDSATVSTITVFTHRDDRVSAHMAKELSRALKRTVCVSAGIHVDDASEDEIALLGYNSSRVCEKLIRRISSAELLSP